MNDEKIIEDKCLVYCSLKYIASDMTSKKGHLPNSYGLSNELSDTLISHISPSEMLFTVNSLWF